MRVISQKAGRCTRLHPLTTHRHKALLQVAGKSILNWQLEAFERARMGSNVVLVTGHSSTKVSAHVAAHPMKQFITIIKNDQYAQMNLDFSVLCAADYLDAPIMYFEGDMLVHPTVLERMAANEKPICLAVERVPMNHQIDTLVRVKGSRVTGLVFAEHGALNQIDYPDTVGELLCAVRFSKEPALALRAELRKIDRFDGPMRLYQIFERLFSQFETSWVETEGLPWIEIDTAGDLDRAQELLSHGFWTPTVATK